jgi:hypothetical protein
VDYCDRVLLEDHTLGNPIQQELQLFPQLQKMDELRGHCRTSKKLWRAQSDLRVLPRPLGRRRHGFRELHLPWINPSKQD